MAKLRTGLLWLLGIVLGCFLLWVMVLFLSSLFVDPNSEYGENSPYYRFLLNGATALAVRVLGIHMHTAGLEKLPIEGRFLLVGNHRSNFDPILTWYVLKDRELAFISKPENFHIPIFGRIIRKCCFLPIDRKDPRNAVRTISSASDLLKNDSVSIAVYPEGTRSKERVLLPFHNGVFKIAHNANVPIVVAAISGTENIHRNYLRRRSDVFFSIVDVIPAEFAASSSTAAIGDRVRGGLEAALYQLEGA